MFCRTCLLLATLSACSLVFDTEHESGTNGENDGGAAPGVWLDGFEYRKRISFHPSSLSSTLADFPVAIHLIADDDIASAAPRNRSEFAITAQDGETLIPYELESFSQDGSLAAWAALESLDNGGAAVYLYFKNSTAMTSNEQVAATWPDDLVSVWHLSQAPDRAPPQFLDSAGDNHGSVVGTPPPTLVAGPVGQALRVSAADNRVDFGDPIDGSLDFGTESFSFSTWVFVTESDNMFDFAMWKGGTADSLVGYGYTLGTDTWRVGISDGTASGNRGVTFGMEAEHLGRWVQLATVMDRGNQEARTYVDGRLVQSFGLTGVGSLSTNQPLSIGTEFSRYNGAIDEMRIYKVAVSDDWIATEFENLSGASFTAVGILETAP